MIVVMRPDASEGAIADVVFALQSAGCRVHRQDSAPVTLATLAGDVDPETVANINGVAAILDSDAKPRVAAVPVESPLDTEWLTRDGGPPPQQEPRGFELRGHRFGGGRPLVIAGPCSVEDEATMREIASRAARAGAIGLRAGAYKPRASPYSFQGAGEPGLTVLRRAADAHGLLVVSEVLDATQIPLAAVYCDVIQVGARNMHNSSLLREVGRSGRPVLLKRGMAATVDEWLSAAEYIASSGESRIILCERGIRTFETATRNTLDLNAVAVVLERSRLPVFVDPSHGTGRRSLVKPLALAAIAAGADGLLIEAHVSPQRALSDAAQTIDMNELETIVRAADQLATTAGIRNANAP